jgi:uncharacterized protein (DUF1778 family)
MPLTERLEIRLSPAEKNLIELAARRNNLTISDYVRMCCLRHAIAEEDPEAIKQLFLAQGQQLIEMLAAGRATTFRVEENRKRVIATAQRRPG